MQNVWKREFDNILNNELNKILYFLITKKIITSDNIYFNNTFFKEGVTSSSFRHFLKSKKLYKGKIDIVGGFNLRE